MYPRPFFYMQLLAKALRIICKSFPNGAINLQNPIMYFSIEKEMCSVLISAGILELSMGARNRVGKGLSYRAARAGIFKKSMGARHRVGIGLSYRPARLHRLAEFIGAP
jgi:hypothetical protein